MKVLFITLAAATLGVAHGHGAMFIPTPRNAMDANLPPWQNGRSPNPDGGCTCVNGYGSASEGCDRGLRGEAGGQSCLWWSQGCSIGCDECVTVHSGTNTSMPMGNKPNAGKIGFRKRYCESNFSATLPRHAWTLNMDVEEGSEEDSYRFNPWRAPGFAPVVDACGQAGGEWGYQKIGGDSVFLNTTYATKGQMGSTLPVLPAANRSKWVAGTYVDVAWGVRYNHGGGYQYRLCKADRDLTEACFQETPLEFDRSAQTLKWNNGSIVFPMGEKAIFVDGDAVNPPGSTWARNPIPRIWDSKLGLHNPEACPGPSTRAAHSPPGCLAFPAPCPWDKYLTEGLLPCDEKMGHCDGDGMSQCSSDWVVGVIADRVKIPDDLPPGEYVLGWRWDCEETAQIWQNCADVNIVAGNAAGNFNFN